MAIERTTIGGVEVLDFTPADGSHDPDRVLINLHGGAFTVGWDGIPHMESIPLASMGRYRIVSVNYRMAPEHKHPAAVEDVAAVYAALLDDYAPGRIGIFGGSAGGVLTAQAAAWLPAHGLLRPARSAYSAQAGLRSKLGSPPTSPATSTRLSRRRLRMAARPSTSPRATSTVSTRAMRAHGPPTTSTSWRPTRRR